MFYHILFDNCQVYFGPGEVAKKSRYLIVGIQIASNELTQSQGKWKASHWEADYTGVEKATENWELLDWITNHHLLK